MQAREAFTASVLDSLSQHVAVLDQDGIIVAVNQAWRDFACGNGAPPALQSPIGMSYLDTCSVNPNTRNHTEVVQASASACGIRAVLSGAQPSFSLEYPCDSPTEKRWFQMNVTPLDGVVGGAVVSHLNITGQRQVELEAHASGVEIANGDVSSFGRDDEIAGGDRRRARRTAAHRGLLLG